MHVKTAKYSKVTNVFKRIKIYNINGYQSIFSYICMYDVPIAKFHLNV